MALFCVATVCAQEPNPEDGAREKGIVDRISEQERQKKTKSPVISPQLPSR
jgi:hypothetical protein